jgi:hypothetical protein
MITQPPIEEQKTRCQNKELARNFDKLIGEPTAKSSK